MTMTVEGLRQLVITMKYPNASTWDDALATKTLLRPSNERKRLLNWVVNKILKIRRDIGIKETTDDPAVILLQTVDIVNHMVPNFIEGTLPKDHQMAIWSSLLNELAIDGNCNLENSSQLVLLNRCEQLPAELVESLREQRSSGYDSLSHSSLNLSKIDGLIAAVKAVVSQPLPALAAFHVQGQEPVETDSDSFAETDSPAILIPRLQEICDNQQFQEVLEHKELAQLLKSAAESVDNQYQVAQSVTVIRKCVAETSELQASRGSRL